MMMTTTLEPCSTFLPFSDSGISYTCTEILKIKIKKIHFVKTQKYNSQPVACKFRNMSELIYFKNNATRSQIHIENDFTIVFI